jgi:hypothetical protein
MKKVFLKGLVQLIIVCLLYLTTTAQKTINVDSSYSLPTKANAFFMSDGQPYVNVKFTRIVQGSPFFIERWNKGYISTREGNKLRDITLRLNLVDQQLHYLKDGVEYVTEQPLHEVLIDDEQTGKLYVFRSGFPAVQYATNKTLYQALAEGEVLLLKHIRKIITESTPFGSATTQQTIRNSETYYISKKGAMIKVKRDKTDLLNALGGKREKLEAFIEQYKIGFKTEEDLIKVVNYYNSI